MIESMLFNVIFELYTMTKIYDLGLNSGTNKKTWEKIQPAMPENNVVQI